MPNMVDGGNIVSPATSKRICAHMNDDHPVSVYAMFLQKVHLEPGWRVTQCSMETVRAEGCDLKAVLCSGDLCNVKKVTFPFDPPLTTTADARPRLIAIHNDVCRPRWMWLVSSLPIFLLLMTSFIFYCMFIGLDQVQALIREDESAFAFVALVFGTPEFFTSLVQKSFWFLIVAHLTEAAFAVSKAVSLKLGYTAIVEWFILTSLVGFPVLGRILELHAIHLKAKKT